MVRRDLCTWTVLLLMAGLSACRCESPSAMSRPELEVNPQSIDFGVVEVGTSSTKTVQLTSRGRTAATIAQLGLQAEMANEFRVVGSVLTGTTLGPSEVLDVTISWTPSVVGNQASRLAIESDAANAPLLLVPILGTAVRSCVPTACASGACGMKSDGCGGTLNCGGCSGAETCGGGGVDGRCGCTAESDTQLCTTAQATCGTVTAVDHCGANRTVNCGSCSSPASCGGAGHANQCGCTPETDVAFCSRLQATCGPLTANDSCGASRTVTCGSCTGPETCGGTGTPNRCGCPSESNQAFCARLHVECSSVTDTDTCGLERTVDCGLCTQPLACAGAGQPQVCEAQWTLVPVPTGVTSNFRGVWGTSASDVWVVGSGSTVLHWNGTAWTNVANPFSGNGASLVDVWGLNANDVWVVGDQGRTMHWNGVSWTSFSTGSAAVLHGVWGSSSTNVWAVGTGGTILQWNGTSWTSRRTGAEYFTGIWGSSATDLWATAHDGTLFRGNGSTWSAFTNPVSGNTTIELEDVSGTSSTDVWACGWAGTALHFDGTTWSSTPTGSPNAVYGCTSPWFVADGGKIFRRLGTTWVSAPSPTSALLYKVWAPANGTGWIVGNSGVVLRR